jgi:hypothetical protein
LLRRSPFPFSKTRKPNNTKTRLRHHKTIKQSKWRHQQNITSMYNSVADSSRACRYTLTTAHSESHNKIPFLFKAPFRRRVTCVAGAPAAPFFLSQRLLLQLNHRRQTILFFLKMIRTVPIRAGPATTSATPAQVPLPPPAPVPPSRANPLSTQLCGTCAVGSPPNQRLCAPVQVLFYLFSTCASALWPYVTLAPEWRSKLPPLRLFD